MSKQPTVCREINAAVKREFGRLPGFVPVKAAFAGSFSTIRAEGGLPTSIATGVANLVARDFPTFVARAAHGGTLTHPNISLWMGGTVIAWQAV